MSQSIRVFVDPSGRMLYSSFYLQGLYDEFGKRNVRFSSRHFRELNRKSDSNSFDHYMAFVIVSPSNHINRIIIDFRDKPGIKQNAWDWCDLYAKINFNPALTDQKYLSKIISVGPSFGIRIWDFWETAWYCVSNFIRCGFLPVAAWKRHLSDYYGQYIRPRMGEYTRRQPVSGESERPYVFMLARLWPGTSVDQTNRLRKEFMQCCRTADCDFEGGFFTSGNSLPEKGYENVWAKRPYTTKEFLKNNQASAFVFNTPAVYNCHGWKLGEFLAMRKAIISSTLVNELPEPLVHGVHIHYVRNREELEAAINLLLTDRSYRAKLEEGAAAYYLRYIEPRSVIQNSILPLCK
ncbi:MAG: hypothetical protein AAGU19_13040 [Prolixibacteraceae bacterium]